MPLEIRELIIKAVVGNQESPGTGSSSGSQGNSDSKAQADEKKHLADEIQKIIKRQKER